MKRVLPPGFYCLVIFLVLTLSPASLHAQTPFADVKINGADGEVTLTLPETLTVSLALDNKGITSPHDWWIAIAAPAGLFFMTPAGLTGTAAPVYQGQLISFPPVTLFDLVLPCSFPPGRYIFAFGVDSPVNGNVNLEGLSVDFGTANILPGGLCASKSVDAAQGGSVSVTNARGDVITLDIPAGSLKESTTITLSALTSPPANPFAANVFPGVIIEPEGLELGKDATLRIAFSAPVASPEQSLLFYLKRPDLAFAVGLGTASATELTGRLSHFSTYAASKPTASEAREQAERYFALITYDPYKWKDTRDAVVGVLNLANLVGRLGDLEKAEELMGRVTDAVARDTGNFLSQPVPQDPCFDYLDALLNFHRMFVKTGGNEDSPLGRQLNERLTSILNKCTNRFELDVNSEMDVNVPNAGTFRVACSGIIDAYIPVYGTDVDAQNVEGAGDLVVSGSGSFGDSGSITAQGTVHVDVTGRMELTEDLRLELHLDLALTSHETLTFCSSGSCTPPVPMPDPHCPMPKQLILPVRDGYIEEWSFAPAGGMTMQYRIKLNVIHLF